MRDLISYTAIGMSVFAVGLSAYNYHRLDRIFHKIDSIRQAVRRSSEDH